MSPPAFARGACRDHLLDSTEEVILRAGLGGLTLDAVAAHAKVSKGGLLYHFPSKDALILGLVERTCDRWRRDYSEAIAGEPPGRGRVARAILRMCLGSRESCYETCRRSSIVLVAAIAANPALTEPLRRAHSDLLSRIREDGGDTGVGEAVVLAANGMWFEQVFGLRDLPASRVESIRGALAALIEMDEERPAPRAKGAPPRTGTSKSKKRLTGRRVRAVVKRRNKP